MEQTEYICEQRVYRHWPSGHTVTQLIPHGYSSALDDFSPFRVTVQGIVGKDTKGQPVMRSMEVEIPASDIERAFETVTDIANAAAEKMLADFKEECRPKIEIPNLRFNTNPNGSRLP